MWQHAVPAGAAGLFSLATTAYVDNVIGCEGSDVRTMTRGRVEARSSAPGKAARRRLFLLLAIGLAVSLPAMLHDNAAIAATSTRADRVVQSGFSGVIPEQNGAPITAGSAPFTFQKVGKIRKITITLTVEDGNTGTGPTDFDRNDLTLALDGIDTGIRLNDFRFSETDRRTISGEPINKQQLKAALKADGKLRASILDADPGNNEDPNNITNPDTTTTVLVLQVTE